MKEKIKSKKNIKGYIFVFILGGLVIGTVGVSAATTWLSQNVTYDNSSSGMSALNVQDAIDELYNSMATGSSISVGGSNVQLDSLDGGLYEDAFEEGRYVYKGPNPNNYITFNDEVAGWRIIALETDGTIKIIRNSSIGDQYWGSSGIWSSSSVRTYLNGTYKSGIDTTYIQTHDFAVGGVISENSDLAYQITTEKQSIWNGDIAVMSVSDYLRANTNMEACGTLSSHSRNYGTCSTANWITSAVGTNGTFMINYYYTDSSYLWVIYNTSGQIGAPYGGGTRGVLPVLYLKSNISLSGSGSIDDPFYIVS